MQLSRRFFSVLAIYMATFAIGSIIYFFHNGTGQGSTEYFYAAVLMFPVGFAAFLPGSGHGPILLFLGWTFYAICTLILLVSKRINVWRVAGAIFVVVLSLDLYSCSRFLTQMNPRSAVIAPFSLPRDNAPQLTASSRYTPDGRRRIWVREVLHLLNRSNS